MSQERSQVPENFDDLADWLLGIGCHFSPAELHGAVVGGICGTMRLSPEQWAAFGTAVLGVDGRLDAAQQNSAQAVLGGLAAAQLALLSDAGLVFDPFLPDDDTDITQRTEQLGGWCKGFMGGFAEAQVFCQRSVGNDFADSGQPPVATEFSEHVREALQDISAIARASFDDAGEVDGTVDDDQADANDDEAWLDSSPNHGDEHGDEDLNERDYFEVVEYLRLAVLTVFTEYGWIEAHTPREKLSGNGSGATLH